MNAVKKNNNNNEQQLAAELENQAQQQLAASLADFGKQLMNEQQQLLQGYSAQILAKSQSQWQQRLIEQEQAYQKLFKDWQQTKQQLDLATPVATADNQELADLQQKSAETARQIATLAAELKKAQQHNSSLSEREVGLEQQLAELTKELEFEQHKTRHAEQALQTAQQSAADPEELAQLHSELEQARAQAHESKLALQQMKTSLQQQQHEAQHNEQQLTELTASYQALQQTAAEQITGAGNKSAAST